MVGEGDKGTSEQSHEGSDELRLVEGEIVFSKGYLGVYARISFEDEMVNSANQLKL